MQIYSDAYKKTGEPCVYALGCFDGVHAAHARVISEAVRIARQLSVKSGVWCFSEPPKNAFLKEPVPLICSHEQKSELISSLGVDIMICPDFDDSIKDVSAEAFLSDILVKCAGAVHIVTGKNYTFGRGGLGNTEMLAQLCRDAGVGLSIIDDVYVDGEKVSSTAVRSAVLSADITRAEKLLARHLSICVKKDCDGRYEVPEKLLCPPDGRYTLDLCGDILRTAAVVEIRDRVVEMS